MIIALALILPVFANVRNIKNESEEGNNTKSEKVYLESIAYLFFEVWRLWLVLDGVCEVEYYFKKYNICTDHKFMSLFFEKKKNLLNYVYRLFK